MKFYFLTLFPEIIDSYLNSSIVKKAIDKGLVDTEIINIRNFTKDKHGRTDDYPFGGGPGMLMTPQPLADSIRSISDWENKEIIYLTPTGKTFNQSEAESLSENNKDKIFICGHYEGIDQRIIDKFVDKCFSTGDYVLTGGELPALTMFDSIIRNIPGVLGNNISAEKESFYENLLEYPQYTRPREFEGMEVPSVLISGNHKKIADWQKEKSIEITKANRPDLYKKYLEESNSEE